MFFQTKRRRHSPYASRFATNHYCIWDCLRPMGAGPITVVLLDIVLGWRFEAIEQYVFTFLKNAGQNYTKIFEKQQKKAKKVNQGNKKEDKKEDVPV